MPLRLMHLSHSQTPLDPMANAIAVGTAAAKQLEIHRDLWRFHMITVFPVHLIGRGMEPLALGGFALYLWRGWPARIGGHQREWLITWFVLVSRQHRHEVTLAGIAIVLRELYVALVFSCRQTAQKLGERVLEVQQSFEHA